MYSLRMSFWVVPLTRSRAHPLLLGGGDVEREEDGGRRVDRHRGADLAQRQAVEQDLHVGERADRNADPTDLALRLRCVGVEAHLRRQVERDRQAGLALIEEVAEPAIRLGRRGEAGVLAHRPQPAAVHRRLDAASERVLAGEPELAPPRRTQPRPRPCRRRRSRCPSWSGTAPGAPRLPLSAEARVVARQRSRSDRSSVMAIRAPAGGRRPRRSRRHRRRPCPRCHLAVLGARSASSWPRRRGSAGRP